MLLLDRFLDPAQVSLKICGVTTAADATQLVALGVHAIGVNFWPQSKRYVRPTDAEWLRAFAGRILRVGVFVNQAPEHIIGLLRDGLLDAVQLHGDETIADTAIYRDAGVPFFKATGVRTAADLTTLPRFGARALLLDAYAPAVHGGTGETCDWYVAAEFRANHPAIPVILAGGIKPENAAAAVKVVRPAALDVASGAEHSPGCKDFDKVAALMAAIC